MAFCKDGSQRGTGVRVWEEGLKDSDPECGPLRHHQDIDRGTGIEFTDESRLQLNDPHEFTDGLQCGFEVSSAFCQALQTFGILLQANDFG